MAHVSHEPQPLFPIGKVSIAVVGTLAGVGAIVVVLWLMEWTSRPADVIPPRFEDRTQQQVLDELRTEDQRQLTTYGWVDRSADIVRIPIDEAIERLVAQAQGRGTDGSSDN